MSNQKRFNQIISDTKQVKIQGATNIALAGIQAYLLHHDKLSVKKILSSRPTEPLLQNSVALLESTPEKEKFERARALKKYIQSSEKKISYFGSNLIKNNSIVFIHCHSSTVMKILERAKNQGKNFTVYVSAAHPLFQGKLSARELSKYKILTVLIPDLTVETFVDKADIVFFGADALLDNGIVNKIGTSIIAKEAKEKKIPAYCASISLKYTKKIKMEFRNPKELFNLNNKYIKGINPAFDITPKENIIKIITEFGIQNYDKFIKNIKIAILPI